MTTALQLTHAVGIKTECKANLQRILELQLTHAVGIKTCSVV